MLTRIFFWKQSTFSLKFYYSVKSEIRPKTVSSYHRDLYKCMAMVKEKDTTCLKQQVVSVMVFCWLPYLQGNNINSKAQNVSKRVCTLSWNTMNILHLVVFTQLNSKYVELCIFICAINVDWSVTRCSNLFSKQCFKQPDMAITQTVHFEGHIWINSFKGVCQVKAYW